MGGQRKTNDDCEIWCEIEEKNYSMIGNNGQTIARVQYNVRIRAKTASERGLTNDSRLIYRGKNLAIQSIAETVQHDYVNLIATHA